MLYKTQFTPALLIVVKVSRLIAINYAIDLATKLQERDYIMQMGEGAARSGLDADEPKPPSMTKIVWVIAAAMVAITLSISGVVQFLSSIELIRPTSLYSTMRESLIYTSFVVVHAYYLKLLLETKRYMNYRNEGIRALRAFKSLLMWMIIPFTFSPVALLA